MNEWRQFVEVEMARIRQRALIGIGASVLLLFWSILIGTGPHSPFFQVLILISSLAAMAASVHLLFDSKLFQLALARQSEPDALHAIDGALAGMGLRDRPNPVPTFAERVAGTHRIARRQGFTLLIAALFLAAQIADARHMLGG